MVLTTPVEMYTTLAAKNAYALVHSRKARFQKTARGTGFSLLIRAMSREATRAQGLTSKGARRAAGKPRQLTKVHPRKN